MNIYIHILVHTVHKACIQASKWVSERLARGAVLVAPKHAALRNPIQFYTSTNTSHAQTPTDDPMCTHTHVLYRSRTLTGIPTTNRGKRVDKKKQQNKYVCVFFLLLTHVCVCGAYTIHTVMFNLADKRLVILVLPRYLLKAHVFCYFSRFHSPNNKIGSVPVLVVVVVHRQQQWPVLGRVPVFPSDFERKCNLLIESKFLRLSSTQKQHTQSD